MDERPHNSFDFDAWTRGYGEQDENGIDLSLIRANLKLTPYERACRSDQARRQALMLQEYGRRYREQAAARPLH
jgi:hypothetical protein